MSVKTTSISSTSKGRLPRLNIHNALIKQRQTFDKSLSSSPSILLSSSSTLSPNLQPPTPPIIPTNQNPNICLPSSFGDKYILVEQIETSNLYKCIDTKTHNEFCCKVCTFHFDFSFRSFVLTFHLDLSFAPLFHI
jgi:hypothetical protein